MSTSIYRIRGDAFESVDVQDATIKGETLTTDDGDVRREYTRTNSLTRWDRRYFQAWFRIDKLGRPAFVYTEARRAAQE